METTSPNLNPPKPEGATREQLIKLIEANAYRVYKSSFRLGGIEKFLKVNVGDLVLETSAMGFANGNGKRLGFLREITKEPYDAATPEKLETVYYIESLLDGKLIRWTNCDLIMVHMSRWDD